jgi:hypothetical protein
MTIPAAGKLAVFDRSPPQLAEAMAQKNLRVLRCRHFHGAASRGAELGRIQ